MKAVQDRPINRTGVATSPKLAEEQAAGSRRTPPSSPGDETEIAKLRAVYQKEGALVGSLPPEPVPSSPIEAVLLDKLGERCAFERTGTRYYEALVQKHRTEGIKKDPSPSELQHFRDEEFAHFELLRRAILKLGGDPTVETPAANIAGVTSKGVGLVLTDPRTTFTQCLEAILVAELADNDGWELLANVAKAAGKKELAEACQGALKEEQNHLQHVRRWLELRTLH
jgi:rubrerythrin